MKRLIDRYIEWKSDREMKRWVKARRKVDYEFDRQLKVLDI